MISLDTQIAGSGGIDTRKYGKLLARFTPKVIETEAENDAALAVIEALMSKGEGRLTAEEDVLLALLLNLSERFEEKAYAMKENGDPVDALQFLMEANDLRPVDLAELFGSRARVSDVLARRRAISKEQARRLGERFRVSAGLFI